MIRRHAETEPHAAAIDPSLLEPREPLAVLGYAVNGAADEVALAMLAHLLSDLPIAMAITGTESQTVELASFVRNGKFSVVCFADLPPSSPSKTRYLVRRLRSALPEMRIAVGRWGPPALADESPQMLLDAGANHVASLLVESQELPRRPPGDAAPSNPGHCGRRRPHRHRRLLVAGHLELTRFLLSRRHQQHDSVQPQPRLPRSVFVRD